MFVFFFVGGVEDERKGYLWLVCLFDSFGSAYL